MNPKEEPLNTREERIDAQRSFLEKERQSIKAYIKDRDLKMERSGTGLYTQVLSDSAAQLQVESERCGRV
ncbi:MAG: hypothetical protein U5L96_04205 [Owenweeksia sp.]|nr:hypothetical protein [Owenweeksia sp.]